jgi:hypothetical protein
MNAPVGLRSAATAVITAEIARLMTCAFPATVTTYKGAELVLLDNSVTQLPARVHHGRTRQYARTFLLHQLLQGFAGVKQGILKGGGCIDTSHGKKHPHQIVHR